MKKIIAFIFIVIGVNQISIAQDSYKKRYYIKKTIEYQEELYNAETEKRDTKTITLDLKSSDGKTINQKVSGLAESKKGLLSNVKFGEKENSNKLYVNPWLIKSDSGDYVDQDKVYYYKLKNRQSVKINFKQWSFNALTVPLKMRFGKDNTEFSTGANLGALIGHTWGTTNFVHRKEVGNKQYDTKNTFGLFLGADKLEFSFKDNTDTEIKIKTAVLSTGIGYLFSYEKFTFGATGGLDFGLGENSSEWDFQGRPWLGLSLGYSLFTF
jgi:hypothetical protein